MKHHIHLLITAHFLITATCCAMEKEKTIFTEITAVKNPRLAFFLTNNQVIINGENGCSIIGIQNNKEVKQISDCPWQHLVLNHNKTKIALYNTDAIKIFDTQTGNEEYTINCLKEITSAVFNQNNDIILACNNPYQHLASMPYAIIQIADKKNITFIRNSFYIHSLFHNTTKKCLYTATSDPHTMIYSYPNKLKNPSDPIKTINNSVHFFECSPNGSLIVVANGNTLYLLDVNNDYNQCGYFEAWDGNIFKAMQFHPNSLYIAVLMEHETSKNIGLKYFNKKAKYITDTFITINQSKKTPVPVRRSRRDPETYNPASISFAPNKKFALVTLYNQCFSVPVPFEIVYQDDAKKKAIFAHFIFKNYKTDAYDIPQDINQHLVSAVLETLQR